MIIFPHRNAYRKQLIPVCTVIGKNYYVLKFNEIFKDCGVDSH